MLKFQSKRTFLGFQLLFIFINLLGYKLVAQNEPTIFNESRKLMGLSIHTGSGVYRDFSTSPLFYELPGLGITFSGIYHTDNTENRFDLDGGFYMWNEQFFQFNGYYHFLRNLPVLKHPKWNLKVGGALLMTQNLRLNSALLNAQIGYEAFTNLMLVGKISRDFSTLQPKPFKFWFIKGTKKPGKRMLSFQMNIGLLNFNSRPSTYNYVYLGAIYGTAISLDKLLKEYKWKLNGWRIGTQIDYTWFYPSGNGRRISYIWDVAHAPGSFEPFDMATHKLQYTILINNKKR
jgi:hypothetical protein